MTEGDAGPYVLVVDDEPSIANLVAMTLRNDGFRVQTAHNGHTALAMLAKACLLYTSDAADE